MDKWILRKHTRAIENVIYRLKVFKIISDKYTNRRNTQTEEMQKQKKCRNRRNAETEEIGLV